MNDVVKRARNGAIDEWGQRSTLPTPFKRFSTVWACRRGRRPSPLPLECLPIHGNGPETTACDAVVGVVCPLRPRLPSPTGHRTLLTPLKHIPGRAGVATPVAATAGY